MVFSQNHDQVGNRKVGDRLTAVASFEQLKLAAAAVLLSPYVPLLFMGEEYGEKAPFQYFVSHSDPSIIEAVRKGRGDEFSSFEWAGELPDPQSEKTFLDSKLDWESRTGRTPSATGVLPRVASLAPRNTCAGRTRQKFAGGLHGGGWQSHFRRRRDGSSHAAIVFYFGSEEQAATCSSCGRLAADVGLDRAAVERSWRRAAKPTQVFG